MDVRKRTGKVLRCGIIDKSLQAKQKNKVMTAIQMGALNAEILRNLGTIAEDEDLLTRVAKYLRKLVVQKKDPTLFTKEEFFSENIWRCWEKNISLQVK